MAMMTSANRAATLEIHQIPCLEDNYGYLVRDPATGVTAATWCPRDGFLFPAIIYQDGAEADQPGGFHHRVLFARACLCGSRGCARFRHGCGF